MNSISVLNNRKLSLDDTNDTTNVENNGHKKIKTFYKMNTINSNFIKYIDLNESKKNI